MLKQGEQAATIQMIQNWFIGTREEFLTTYIFLLLYLPRTLWEQLHLQIKDNNNLGLGRRQQGKSPMTNLSDKSILDLSCSPTIYPDFFPIQFRFDKLNVIWRRHRGGSGDKY